MNWDRIPSAEPGLTIAHGRAQLGVESHHYQDPPWRTHFTRTIMRDRWAVRDLG